MSCSEMKGFYGKGESSCLYRVQDALLPLMAPLESAAQRARDALSEAPAPLAASLQSFYFTKANR